MISNAVAGSHTLYVSTVEADARDIERIVYDPPPGKVQQYPRHHNKEREQLK